MTKINLKFTIFCVLLAGSSLVHCDDGKVSTERVKTSARPRGCCYKGKYIAEGQTETVAPCQYGTCSAGKVIIAIQDCAPPKPGCRYESTIEHCCKEICDKGCNYKGIFIPEGQSKTVAPCQYAYCNKGQVALAIADCARPEPSCRYESTLEECCKKICDVGCNYNGTFIPEGERRAVEPCTYADCNGGQINIAIADCVSPPSNCHYEPTLADCCNLVCDEPPVDVDVDITPGPKV